MTMDDVHREIATKCGEIADMFRPGALVTVVVRNPKYGVDGSADMYVSDDDPDLVNAAIRRLTSRPTRVLP